MKKWNDEAEYRKRYSLQDLRFDEVAGGYYAEGLPEEFYFVWHIVREDDGFYRVVLDFFLPWDAADLTWDYHWTSKDKAILWARNAARKLAAVERAYVKKHGVQPGVIEVVEQAMEQNVHDSPQYRPGPKAREQDWSSRRQGPRRRRD